MPPFIERNEVHDGSKHRNTTVEADLADVRNLVQQVVTDRLPKVDTILKNANLLWSDIDVLLFTGQTTRSPDVRLAVMKHIGKRRQKPLKCVVVPPEPPLQAASSSPPSVPSPRGRAVHTDPVPTAFAEKVLFFDPKVCVPGGAAIYGSKCIASQRLEVVLPRRSSITVLSAEDDAIRVGIPLPAFLALPLEEHADTVETEYHLGADPVVVPLPDYPDSAAHPVFVLVDSNDAFIVASVVEEDSEFPPPPSALSNALRCLTAERADQLELQAGGPVWWIAAPMQPGRRSP